MRRAVSAALASLALLVACGGGGAAIGGGGGSGSGSGGGSGSGARIGGSGGGAGDDDASTGAPDASGGDATSSGGDCGGADPYETIYDGLDPARLDALMRAMSGVDPVSVKGQTYTITNRYAADAKAQWRAYWEQYMTALGMAPTELAYPTQDGAGESQGHDVEAVLPGASADSVVFIVHYDSIGPQGQETANPGADDDMSGMSILMETARLLASTCFRRQNTVRFVAADQEELGGLEGARQYAAHIQSLAQQQGFKLVGGIDFEQSGWNCASDNLCTAAEGGKRYDLISCSDDGKWSFPALETEVEQTATAYGSSLTPHAICIGEASDNWALWEIGVPTVVIAEYDGFQNPHFDREGGDTCATIDGAYHASIARVAAAFAAKLVGLH